MTSPLRRAVEQRSAAPLAWLATRPRWIPSCSCWRCWSVAVAPPAAGVLLLAALLLLLGWLTFLSWPRLTPGARLARAGVLALVLVAVVARALDG